jgi:hypothetical protein
MQCRHSNVHREVDEEESRRKNETTTSAPTRNKMTTIQRSVLKNLIVSSPKHSSRGLLSQLFIRAENWDKKTLRQLDKDR